MESESDGRCCLFVCLSQDFPIFFGRGILGIVFSGFSSLLHLLVKSCHFNQFFTIVIIITIVLIVISQTDFSPSSFNNVTLCYSMCSLKTLAGIMYYHTNHNQNVLKRFVSEMCRCVLPECCRKSFDEKASRRNVALWYFQMTP